MPETEVPKDASVMKDFVEDSHDDGLRPESEPYRIPPVIVGNDNASANIVATWLCFFNFAKATGLRELGTQGTVLGAASAV